MSERSERINITARADLDHGPFWAAAERGELVVEHCRTAGHVLHLPRGYCARCDSFDTEWHAVSGDASVHTWTVVEHTVDPAFPVPYTLALVELFDPPGVRFVTHLDGRVDLEPGQPMALRFERRGDRAVPCWAPVHGGRR
jgi:uncharacterized OB-fold protein